MSIVTGHIPGERHDIAIDWRSFLYGSYEFEWRNALTIEQIKKAADLVKSISPNTIIMCDNCYGEFTDYTEPTENNVDIIAGSLKAFCMARMNSIALSLLPNLIEQL